VSISSCTMLRLRTSDAILYYIVSWSRSSVRVLSAADSMRLQVHKSVAMQATFWIFAVLWLLSVHGRRVVASALPARLPIHIAIADFDGDSRPDLASIEAGPSSSRNTRYWIAFRLSAGDGRIVGLTAPTGGLQVASIDVNGDSFPDLVVTTAWTNQPVAILLNDGLGNFIPSSPSEFPNAFVGSTAHWTGASNQIRDATAMLVSRSPLGDCRARRKTSLHTTTSRLAAASAVSASLVAFLLPSAGRAPPA
jgi:hypothetical protein